MNIYEAIADIMREGYAISKEKTNSQQGFKYRGIDDVMNTFQPLMASRGIFVVPEVLDMTREERQTNKGGNLLYSVLTVKYTFYASDGSSISAVVVGEGMDSGDKASNKAMAVAMKYAMFQTFCIPTEEMQDPDSETQPPSVPKKKGPPTAEELKAQAKEQPVLCSHCGKEIKPYYSDDGKLISVKRHVEGSRERFEGKVWCIDCIKDYLGGKPNA